MLDPPWHNGQFGIQSWVDFDRVKKQKGQNKMCNHLHFYMAKDIKTGQQSNFHWEKFSKSLHFFTTFMLDKLWDLLNENLYSLKVGKNILKSYLFWTPRYTNNWIKVNSVQEACVKCFAVHILKFEILQTTWKNKTKNIKMLDLLMKNWKLRDWCVLFVSFFQCDLQDFKF